MSVTQINGTFPDSTTVASMSLPAGSYWLNSVAEVFLESYRDDSGFHAGDGLCILNPQVADGIHLQAPGVSANLIGSATVQTLEHPSYSELVTLPTDGTVSLTCSRFDGHMRITHAQLQAIPVGGVSRS